MPALVFTPNSDTPSTPGDRELTDSLRRGDAQWTILDLPEEGDLPDPIIEVSDMLDDLRAHEALKGGDLPPVHPPRVRALNNWVFARAYWIQIVEGSPLTSVPLYAHEVHLFIRPEWLITLKYPPKRWDVMRRAPRNDRPSPVIDIPFQRIWEEFRDANLFRGAPVGLAIASTFLKAIVASYLSALDKLASQASAIESRVLLRAGLIEHTDDDHRGIDSSGSALYRDVLELRNLLRQVRWAFLPDDEISEFVTGPFSHVRDRDTELAFQDIQAESRRALDTTRDVLDQVQQTVELNTSINAQRVDRSIYILTIFTAVLLGPTLLAGIYGMNFARIPGSDAPSGFLWTVVAMLVLAAAIGGGIWALIGRNKR